VTMIVDLLFKQSLQCRTEDQAVMMEFLVELNDHYNEVKLGTRVAGAFNKRRMCEEQNPAIQADAKLVSEGSNGQIPEVNSANVKMVLSSLTQRQEYLTAASGTAEQEGKGADGFVALGRLTGSKGFSNFEHVCGTPTT